MPTPKIASAALRDKAPHPITPAPMVSVIIKLTKAKTTELTIKNSAEPYYIQSLVFCFIFKFKVYKK
jgi:hypothetical protein